MPALCFYNDEISPSDGLTKHDMRKTHTVYVSFVELVFEAMGCEECWFLVSVVRSSVAAKLPGGLSRICQLLLSTYFSSQTK